MKSEMKIISVGEKELAAAACIHSASWQESHKSFCSPEFVAQHSPQRQEAYLLGEMEEGKALYMLVCGEPVGIVSVWGGLIENLYVLPNRQRRGYGTALLEYAMERCSGIPTLWILSNNSDAKRLYEKHGFRATGRRNMLTETLSEIEMRLNVETEKEGGF